MKRFIYTTLLVLMAAPHALAAPAINDAGANALKARVQSVLDYQTAALKASGMTLVQTGDLTVEPAGTYYAITSPQISLEMPDNTTRTIGMLAINAVPTDDADTFRMAVAIPTPILDTDAEGKTIGRITIGQQSMNGLFNFPLRNFSEHSATYKDINASLKDGVTLTIPSLITRSKLTDRGQGLLSGPKQTTIQGLKYKDENGDFSAQSLDLRTNVELFDIAAANLFQTALQQNLTAPQPQTSLPDLAVTYLMRAADAFDITLNATGLRFTPAKTAPDATVPVTQAGSATLAMAAKNLKSGNGSINWQNTIEGITTTNGTLPASVQPTRLSLSLALDGLPAQTALNQVNALEEIKKSGSKMTLRRLHIDAPDYTIDAKGDLAFDTAAAHGLTADTALSIRGLETLVATLGQHNKTVKIPPHIMAILGVAQMTGEQKTDDQGRAVRQYSLKLDKQGAISLNGAPLLQAAPAKQP